MKLTEYIKHTKNDIQCGSARKKLDARKENQGRKKLRVVKHCTSHFHYHHKTRPHENTLKIEKVSHHSEYPTVK